MPGYELIGKEEKNQVLEIFEKSNTLFRHGFDDRRNNVFKVRDFENEFSKKFGCSDSLAVTSGTAALKVALEALSLKEGDEIITQAFTFVATVEAIVEANASPVICEIDRSLNIDHIKPLKTHWNLRLDINNLQILCKDCNKFKASKQNNPKEEAFINKQRIVQEKMDEEERIADIVELREQRRIKKEYRLFFKGY